MKTSVSLLIKVYSKFVIYYSDFVRMLKASLAQVACMLVRHFSHFSLLSKRWADSNFFFSLVQKNQMLVQCNTDTIRIQSLSTKCEIFQFCFFLRSVQWAKGQLNVEPTNAWIRLIKNKNILEIGRGICIWYNEPAIFVLHENLT